MTILVINPLDAVIATLLVIAIVGYVLNKQRGTQPHPDCVTCGEFATHTIAGQPLCENHARVAHQAGYQAEPIR